MPYMLTFFPLLLSSENFSMYSVPCCPYFPSWVDLGQSSDQKVHQGEFTPIISGVKVLSVVCCTLNNNHIKDSTGGTLTPWLLSPITAWNENILLISGKELQVKKNLPRKELLANRVTVGLCSHVTGGRRSPFLPSLTFLSALYNRNEALDVEGHSVDDVDDGTATPEVLWRPERSVLCIKITSTRKKRWVIAGGDSLLRGAEGPACQTDTPGRELCCLPGVWFKDITRKCLSLVQGSLEYYPFFLFYMGGNKAVKSSPRTIK